MVSVEKVSRFPWRPDHNEWQALERAMGDPKATDQTVFELLERVAIATLLREGFDEYSARDVIARAMKGFREEYTRRGMTRETKEWIFLFFSHQRVALGLSPLPK